MAVIEKSIVIHAPIEKVFELLDDPHRIPEYSPSVSRVEDVHQSDGRHGDSVRIHYSLMGIDLPTTLTVREHTRPGKIVVGLHGAVHGTVTTTLEPQGDATQVKMHVDYEIRGGRVGKAIDHLLLERMTEKNAERWLENVKLITEHG